LQWEGRQYAGRMAEVGGDMKHIYGKYYVEKETAGRFQILQETGRGYASIGCYFSPALAAEEIADREHGEKWIRERIEEEITRENGRF
jgi:hypothetical protein